MTGKPKKVYDKEVKSFIFDLDGSAKIQLPQNDRDSLGLTQSFLAVQVKVSQIKGFSLELALLDQTRQRRRIVCVPGIKETVTNALHARVGNEFLCGQHSAADMQTTRTVIHVNCTARATLWLTGRSRWTRFRWALYCEEYGSICASTFAI